MNKEKILAIARFIKVLFINPHRLRVTISDIINKSKKSVPKFTIRMVVYVYAVLMVIIDAIDFLLTKRLRWDMYTINALLSTILIFWVFSAQYYTEIIENQKYYFDDESYKKNYAKYHKWISGDVLKDKTSVWPYLFIFPYYAVWLFVTVMITIWFVNLKLYSLDSGILGLANTVLLFLVLFANGNSVFSIGVYTYFLCDLYCSEEESIKNKRKSELSHYETLPSYTNGIRRLLRDAKAYSTSFLFVALCFTIQLVICIISSDSIKTLLDNGRFQFIIAFVVLLCLGLYVISTLGTRYYIRKLVGLWREETLSKYETIIKELNPVEDREKIIQWEQLIRFVEKECISLIPSKIELLFTALGVLINLIPIILNSIQLVK